MPRRRRLQASATSMTSCWPSWSSSRSTRGLSATCPLPQCPPAHLLPLHDLSSVVFRPAMACLGAITLHHVPELYHDIAPH